MAIEQIMLYTLSALCGAVVLVAPSFAVSFDISQFDRGRNPNTSIIVLDWLVQFLVFCGLVLLCWIAYDNAVNYKEPTKKNLIFLSLPNVLTNDESLTPNKKFVDNFNEVIELNQEVFIVLTDDWATGKDIQFVNKFIKEDFGVKAEVVGILPTFKHRRTKSNRITSWLQESKQKWDSITVIDSQYILDFASNQIHVQYGLVKHKSDLIKLRLSIKEPSIPKVKDLVPTEMELTTKPYFGGRRLLNGQDISDQTSRKELEAANARSFYRPSSANIQHRGQTP